jgi:hypothetical protein
MKKIIIILCLVIPGLSAFSQQVATVNFSGSTKITPDASNRVTVSVKNTQKLDIVKTSTPWLVTMIYKGSTTAGQVFNKTVDLGNILEAGKTKNYEFTIQGPTLAGEYDVEIVLKRGRDIESNTEKITFVVAANYEVSIVPKVTSYYVERGKTQWIDLKFTIINTGNTAWPEGKYSLEFDASSSPSGASTTDRKVFDFDPKEVEFWDLEPGGKADFDIPKFTPPYSEGTYSFRVTLLLNGRAFDADGNPKTISLNFKVK